jgi:predicted nucleic acid-binding protein
MYVLDTSVASSLLKQERGRTAEWIAQQAADELYLAATVVYELTRGIVRLPPGRRREAMELALDQRVLPAFEGRILPLDTKAAQVWAQLVAGGENRGFIPPFLDAQIAAIAMAHSMTVVIRDRRGFGRLGCDLIVLD